MNFGNIKSGGKEKATKRIEIVITPGKLGDVKRAIIDAGVQGMTITNSSGYTWDKARTEVYRGRQVPVDTVPMITVNTVVEDSMVDAVTDAILKAARTGDDGQGRVGDGKIFVHEVVQAIRIRTGATESKAIERDFG